MLQKEVSLNNYLDDDEIRELQGSTNVRSFVKFLEQSIVEHALIAVTGNILCYDNAERTQAELAKLEGFINGIKEIIKLLRYEEEE